MIRGNILKLDHKDFVILVNSQTGSYFKLSKEVYDIIESIYKEYKVTKNNYKIIIDEMIEFDCNEDKEYLLSIINEMYSLNILGNKIVSEVESISLSITNRCNLKCTHCCTDSGNLECNDLSTEKIKEMLINIVDFEPKSIMISGGEPMIRKDFFDITRFLRKIYNGKLVLSTNGTLFSSDNLKDLASLYDEFEISLDGVDEESCKIIRGENVFGLVKKNIESLKKLAGSKRVYVSMVFGEKNLNLRKKFFKLNKELNTIPHERALFNVGRAMDSDIMKLFYEKENIDYYIPKDFLESRNFKGASCKAGYKTIFISHEGNIYPCPSLIDEGYILGNIFDIKNIKLYRENCYNKIFTQATADNIIYKNCKTCCVRFFCWTCPGELNELKSNKVAVKRKCKLVKATMRDTIYGG